MPKGTAVTAVFIGLLLFFQCSHTNAPTDVSSGNQNLTIDQTINLHPEKVGAVVGVFHDSTSTLTTRKLILYDYFNTSSYKICYDSSYSIKDPFFSPDRKKLLFMDFNTRTSDYGYDFILYDLETNIFHKIYQFLDSLPVNGWGPIWNPDGTGFFFTNSSIWYYNHYILYYDISSRYVRALSNSGDVYPVMSINSDSLVVFTRDSVTTGRHAGFYYMDMNGNYISRINNPHLYGTYNPLGVVNESEHFSWNNDLGLFVYSEVTNKLSTAKISISNLSGTYYKNYTSNEYIDIYPEWIDNGNSIVFQRQTNNQTTYKAWIMIIDVRTGNIRVLLDTSFINNCIQFRNR